MLSRVFFDSEPFDWIDPTAEPTGIWKTINDAVESVGNSTYQTLLTVCTICFIISMVCALLMFFGPQKFREFAKEKIVWILVAGLGLFSTTGIGYAVAKIGAEFGESMRDSADTLDESFIEMESDKKSIHASGLLFDIYTSEMTGVLGDDYTITFS